MTVVSITAGHAEASSTNRLGRQLGQRAADRLGTTSVELELRTFAEAIIRALVHRTDEPSVLAGIEAVRAADALVVVTPTVNASFSGLLKSFLDVLPPDSLRGLPTAIAATGGTKRHTLVLDQSVRPMLAYLRAVVLPSALFVTADEWDGAEPVADLSVRMDLVADELALFARATQPPAEGTEPPRPAAHARR